MYVSLTYPFNIAQHKLSHIVEHRKLDSLATPDNTVWSTVTSCWTDNVRQFDPSLLFMKFLYLVAVEISIRHSWGVSTNAYRRKEQQTISERYSLFVEF